MRTAILGGTFNPLHWGHIAIAEEVRHAGGFDEILFIPANIPPHKEVNDPGPALRLAMLKSGLSAYSWARISSCEIDRGGVSYSIETVRELVARGEVEPLPGLIIGDDLIGGLDSWRESGSLLSETLPVLVRRGGDTGLTAAFPHIRIDNPLVPYSSSDIRRRIAAGEPWTYMVPEQVRDFIRKRGLYGCGAV